MPDCGKYRPKGRCAPFSHRPDTQEGGATVVDTFLADNIASDCGGAVYIDYGAFPSFDACTISGNASTGNGGGIAIDYMGRYVNMIDSSTITNNRSTSGEDDIDDDRSMGTLQSPMEM